MRRSIRRVRAFALAVCLVSAFAAQAVVPGEVNYQGLLLDDTGVPVDGSAALLFEIFDAETAGALLWSESHPSVPVVEGVYSVALGSIAPLDDAVLAGGTVYLQITVDGETLAPRQRLLAVPYAMRAAVAESTTTIDGVPAEFVSQLFLHTNFDGGPPSDDPREGFADTDGDSVLNFIDPDNDDDGLTDATEIAQGSDINVSTPVLSGFSPTSADGFTGGTVTVTGANFEPGLSVSFGNQTPSPTNLGSNSFDVALAPNPPGDVVVEVILPNGESDTATFSFFFVQPTLTGFLPPVADGFSGETVTVQGTNFQPGLTVTFGSQTPTPTNVGPTSFEVDLGPNAPGTVVVEVTLPNGESATRNFEFAYPVPSVESIAPTVVDEQTLTTVAVTGQSFLAGLTLQVGSQTPTPMNVTATSFDFDLGPEPPGMLDLTVTHPSGTFTTVVDAITVQVGSPRIVFLTSSTYTGDLGGLAGADAICQSHADAAGLSGTYQAWLSDSTESPSTRSTQAGQPYLTATGPVLATDWADLTDGSLARRPNITEQGAILASGSVMTNTAADGTAVGADHCADWTDGTSASSARYGTASATNGLWTSLDSGGCDEPRRLYCVQQ